MRLILSSVLLISVFYSVASAAEPVSSEPIDPSTLEIVNSYPLDMCIVSDEPLGSMGESKSFVHAGQVFSLCCKSCVKDFAKNPAHYHDKLAAAVASQVPGEGEDKAVEEGQGHTGHDHGAQDHDHSEHGHHDH